MIYIIANWKCNPAGVKEAKTLFAKIMAKARGLRKIKLIICPPACYLPLLKVSLKNASLGGQNSLWGDCGAYTGELSPRQLADLKCKYVIIGHSERRKYFFETNETANRKIKTALDFKLTPIYCVGETAEEKEQGRTLEVIKNQLDAGLAGIDAKDAGKIMIAYEPVWAIGTGNACAPADAKRVSDSIRVMRGEDAVVLYGGSVNAENAVSYLKEAGYSGLLVGGVSLKADEFAKLMKEAGKA